MHIAGGHRRGQHGHRFGAAGGECGAGTGSDTITFALPAGTSIDLRSDLPEITDSVAIAGPGSGSLYIFGAEAYRIFYLRAPTAGVTIDISGLTLEAGRAEQGSGGAIYVATRLTLNLSKVVFLYNGAGGGGGGAVFILGSADVAVDQCTFHSNGTDGGLLGGAAIALAPIGADASLTVTNSTFSDNRNISLDGPSPPPGGAIVAQVTGLPATLEIKNTTFSGNSAFGHGGAIYLAGASLQANLDSVTVIRNTADSAEAGFADGGGIYNDGASVTLRNSIIARNNDGSPSWPVFPDVSGYFVSAGHNLIGDGTGGVIAWMSADQIGTPAGPIDPLLGVLSFNGGSTQTRLPRPGSPAVDQGNCPALIADQRGAPRPFDAQAKPNALGGDGCDIGAVELRPADFGS